MSKTFHRKWGDKYDGGNKKSKFQTRRDRRRKVYHDKTNLMDSYISPSEDEMEPEDAQLYSRQ